MGPDSMNRFTQNSYRLLVLLATLVGVSPCPAEEPKPATAASADVSALLNAGRFREALTALEQQPATDEAPAPRLLRARALLGMGRYQDAESILTKTSANDPVALDLLSRSVEARGDLDRALALMANAVEMKRKGLASTESVEGASAQAEFHTKLGALAFRAGQLAAARTQFQKAIALVNQAHAKLHELGVPHDESDPRLFAAEATAGLALVYAAQGDKTRAERTWRGVAARSDDPAVVASLAASYVAKGDLKGANRHYDRALRLTEKKPAHRRTRALILIDRNSASDEALTLAEAAFQDGPDLYARDTLAWVLHRRGENPRASEILRPALEVGTRDPLLLYHAGVIAQALGQRQEATRLLTQALELNPNFDPVAAPEARKALERLR